jgi:hypothetical protein
MEPIIQRGNQLEALRLQGLSDPQDGGDAASKDYVDANSGAQGSQGFQGSVGQTGTAGGPSQRYTYSSSTSGNPSSGTFRFNNSNPFSATQLVANQINLAGINSSSWFNAVPISRFVVYLETNPGVYVVYNATAVSFDNPNSTVTLTVSSVSGSSASPTFTGVAIFTYATTGNQGFQGSQGSQGFQGFQGSQGSQGSQGVQGTAGSQGSSGPQGFQGPQGNQGFQGFQGPADGAQGFQGYQGEAGEAGGPTQIYEFDSATFGNPTAGKFRFNNSDPSLVTQIVANYTNLAGITVNSWFGALNPSVLNVYAVGSSQTGYAVYRVTGVSFDNVNSVVTLTVTYQNSPTVTVFSGATALTYSIAGVQGAQGSQGSQGNQGSQGSQGSVGTQGFQGNVGAQGNQGFQGPTGAQGDTGAQGAQGNQGFQGPADGAQGAQGFQGAQGSQGNQGFQGQTGAQGDQGFQGSTGSQGAEGSGGDTQLYTWDTGTSDADPGSGNVRFNNSTYSSVTRIYASTSNKGGVNIAGWLDAFDDFGMTTNRGVLKLFTSADPNNFITFLVTGSVTTATGYRKLDVTFQHSSGTTFSAGVDIAFTWTYTGNQGNQGVQGQTGTPGNDGAQGFQGSQGHQGFQGQTGSQGAAGATGNQGSQGAQGSEGPQGFQGTQGATGSQGSQGFQGTSGASSAGGDTQLFFFNTNTADSDPGDGYLKFNNATYSSVTQMFVDLLNSSLVDVTGWLESLDNFGSSINRGTIKIYKKTDVNTFATFIFTGSVTTATGYRKFSVTYQDDSGTTFSLNDEVAFTFAFAGPAGAQGFQGFQGNQGNQGFQGSQGNQGFQGPQGSQGFQGNQGFQGVAGNDPRFLWLFAT